MKNRVTMHTAIKMLTTIDGTEMKIGGPDMMAIGTMTVDMQAETISTQGRMIGIVDFAICHPRGTVMATIEGLIIMTTDNVIILVPGKLKLCFDSLRLIIREDMSMY